ncbi:hypothetical protein O0L34_g596 [Tuta absoluta]|nr:hypothetical protein O0L34_g596 [Tuta absoluta]
METDTRLAKEFLEGNKAELDLLIDDSQQGVKRPLKEMTKAEPGDIKNDTMSELLHVLAKKIEDNAELFSQLEALKRRVSKEDIKKYDINILVQNINHININNHWYEYFPEIIGLGSKINTPDDLVMGVLTPLATWGIAVQYISQKKSFTIQYCDATSAICYLFARLLRDAGADMFLSPLMTISFVYKKHSKEPANWRGGCTGVVTEHSDIDSAADALLDSTSSPVEYEWKLKRIYVQESVYERFKNTLSWKCTLKPSGDQAYEDVSPQSSEVFICEQKVFLLDYAGALEQIKDTKHVILVEAYRTNKELLSMLKKDVPSCVSLWSNDLSESNEIAYGLKVNIIWINDYGEFNGPLKVSQALFNYHRKSREALNGAGADKLLKMADKWSKLNFTDRVEIINNNLYVCNDLMLDKLNAVKVLLNSENNQTVKIDKGKMWVVIDEPNNFVFQRVTDSVQDIQLVKMLTILAHGSVCVWTADEHSDARIVNILTKLENANLPIARYESLGELHGNVPSSLYQTRVVCSNYGTIFAN